MTNAARLADNLNVDFIVIASFPWPAHLWSYVPARIRFLSRLAEQRNFSACFLHAAAHWLWLCANIFPARSTSGFGVV